jgi:hypothetical protein
LAPSRIFSFDGLKFFIDLAPAVYMASFSIYTLFYPSAEFKAFILSISYMGGLLCPNISSKMEIRASLSTNSLYLSPFPAGLRLTALIVPLTEKTVPSVLSFVLDLIMVVLELSCLKCSRLQ